MKKNHIQKHAIESKALEWSFNRAEEVLKIKPMSIMEIWHLVSIDWDWIGTERSNKVVGRNPVHGLQLFRKYLQNSHEKLWCDNNGLWHIRENKQ